MIEATRSGDYGPLIFYVITVVFCVSLVFDPGKVNSRIEERLKPGPVGRLYRLIPSWAFRYGPLLGLALITAGMLVA